MNTYESVVILTNKLSDEEKTAQVEKISQIISSNGGEMIGVDDWKTKKLAYEIKHETEGAYYLFNFNANPSIIAEYERLLRIDNKVLKHLVIKK